MSYKTLINSNVRKAFNLVKDLAEDVILSKKTASEFNFSTGEAKLTIENIPTKAIITSSDKSAKETNIIMKVMLLKTQDIGDISAYDVVTIGAIPWKIGPLIESDNYVTVTQIYKEV